ncbi:MAG: hypothetical protein ACYDD7_12315, partial [Acidimicrobiales bacterium]
MPAANDPRTSPHRRRRRAGRGFPPGRTLHLVDLNNLLGVGGGARWVEPRHVVGVLDCYRAAACVRSGDHTIIRATSALAVQAKVAWPGARVCLRRGRLADSP